MQSKYENYPFGMIGLANLVSLSIYAIGIYIFAQWRIIFGVIYFVYCIWIEINLYRGSGVILFLVEIDEKNGEVPVVLKT